MNTAEIRPPQPSAQSSEKDHAVELARKILSQDIVGIGNDQLRVLARQLLRALALTP